jgi:hypothetical protein
MLAWTEYTVRNLGALQAELAANGLADLVVLFDIKASAGTIYRTDRVWDNSWDGTFGGNSYVPDIIGVSAIEHGLLGQRPSFTLEIQNVQHPTTLAALPWSTYIEANGDLNETEIVIRVAKLSLLVAADETSILAEQRWYVSGGGIEGTICKMRCGPPADALSWEAPVFSIMSDTCGWTYKSFPCTSTSDLPKCGYTLADCAKRFPKGAALKIGPGFPFFVKASRRRTGAA